jgi:hypothetical protein
MPDKRSWIGALVRPVRAITAPPEKPLWLLYPEAGDNEFMHRDGGWKVTSDGKIIVSLA